MITFAQYPARPAITVRDDLCIGYLIQTPETETLYALQDGKAFRAGPYARPNVHFDRKGRKWVEVPTIPESAEYCGTYPKVKA